MKGDMFLKLDGIQGESVDAKHAGAIDVLHWEWQMKQSGTMHTGQGGGSGKVKVGNIIVTKFVEKSSPILMQLCCRGTHIDHAVLTVRKAGGKPLEFTKIRLKDVLITRIQAGGSGEIVTENVTLNFAQFEVEYVPQKADGSGDASILAAWNIPQNCAC